MKVLSLYIEGLWKLLKRFKDLSILLPEYHYMILDYCFRKKVTMKVLNLYLGGLWRLLKRLNLRSILQQSH